MNEQPPALHVTGHEFFQPRRITGVVAAIGLTRMLRSLLYGVTPLDPIAYALVLLALIPSLAVATALPARRATRVDPNEALKAQ